LSIVLFIVAFLNIST